LVTSKAFDDAVAKEYSLGIREYSKGGSNDVLWALTFLVRVVVSDADAVALIFGEAGEKAKAVDDAVTREFSLGKRLYVYAD
jgi:hypothetical protein